MNESQSLNELLLVANGQPIATIADTPENMMWLLTWFTVSYLGENKYKRYKIEAR